VAGLCLALCKMHVWKKDPQSRWWHHNYVKTTSSSSLFGKHHQCIAPLAANSPHSDCDWRLYRN